MKNSPKTIEEITKEYFTIAGIFVVMNTLDHVITYKALLSSERVFEQNPVTNWFVQNYGVGQGLLVHFLAGSAIWVWTGYHIAKEKSTQGKTVICLATAAETFVACRGLYCYLSYFS